MMIVECADLCNLLGDISRDLIVKWGRRGRDRMIVGFTTTCAISVPITTNDVSFEPLYNIL